MKKKWKRLIILSPLIVFLVVWGFSLVKCEVLTIMHGEEFLNDNVFEKYTMIGDIEYIKLLKYEDDYAQIYYVSKGNEMGSLLNFEKQEDEWVGGKSHNTLWSTKGNADRVVFPYWWHIFYVYHLMV